MKIRCTTILFVSACIVNACSYGLTAKRFPPAQGPRGVMMTVTTEQRTFPGELIEVRDNGLVILSRPDGKLLFVPYAATRASTIEQTDQRYEIKNGRQPPPDVHEHLRLISRFPQGLTPELLQQLLAMYQQTELALPTP